MALSNIHQVLELHGFNVDTGRQEFYTFAYAWEQFVQSKARWLGRHIQPDKGTVTYAEAAEWFAAHREHFQASLKLYIKGLEATMENTKRDLDLANEIYKASESCTPDHPVTSLEPSRSRYLSDYTSTIQHIQSTGT